MPYKASLKSGAPRKRPKPTHRVANARAYNQSLKRRGQLSLYCPEGDLKALFINGRPYVPGVSGRAPTYTNAYIELIVDSTGMNFGRASEWHRQKYGRDARRTPWSKVHLSIDPDMNIHAIAVTEDHVSDEAGLDAVLAVDANVDCVIADGAYYSIAQTEAWSSSGVLPVIPPPTNAVIHGQPTTRWHDHLVRYIKDKGIHAFRNKYGYGKRARVEAQISRIKRRIGSRLLTRRFESQQREGVIIANLVNRWNSFGKAVCVKTA